MAQAHTTSKRGGYGDWNVGAMTRRILKWHDGASDADRHTGLTWYDDARAFAGTLAKGTGYSVAQVAGVIAVLSPQVDWNGNMRGAVNACAHHMAGQRPERIDEYSGYRANVAKAWRVLDGDLDAVRGPKVEAFAAAIRGDMSHVVVDAWAIRAARDARRALALYASEDEQDGIVEKRAIAEAYRRAAALRGITPSAMQAVVWVAVRGSGTFKRTQDMTPAERVRFYRRQARARVAIGLPAMPSWWGDTAKRDRVAAAIGAVA